MRVDIASRVPVARSISWTVVHTLLMRLSGIVAVPLILTHFDGDTYAAWVVAGALIGSQGLVDLGAGAVITRYAAAEASRGSRAGVRGVMQAGGLFYGVLSAVVLAAMVAVILLTPGPLAGRGEAGTDVLFACAAVAFGLTNARLVFASVVEGTGRVDRSYALQCIEPVLFLAVLVAGIAADVGYAAVGAAWVASALGGALLLGAGAFVGVRGLGDAPATPVSLGEVARLGGGWQVSAWADFASFQAPRVLAGLFLPVANLVVLDIALRLAQVVVFPLFALFPLVMPLVTRAREQEGQEAARRVAHELERIVQAMTVLGIGLVLPLLVPAAVVWTGLPAGGLDQFVFAAVMAGAALHASTGVLTSTLLAFGTVRKVVVYKALQLGLALALVSPASVIDERLAAAAILVSLGAPALWFNHAGIRAVEIDAPWPPAALARLLAVAGAGCAAVWATVAVAASMPAVVELLTGSLVALAALGAAALLLDLRPATVRARVAGGAQAPAG